MLMVRCNMVNKRSIISGIISEPTMGTWPVAGILWKMVGGFIMMLMLMAVALACCMVSIKLIINHIILMLQMAMKRSAYRLLIIKPTILIQLW